MRPTCPACGWVYFAKPAFGAAIAIEIDGQIVLVQRKHEPYQGWWMLPAGFVEYEEFAEDTAVREAEEETGLVVTLTGLLGLYHGLSDPRNPSHLAVYAARPIGGEMRPADDALDVRTFAPDALPEKIAFEGQRYALRDWAASAALRADLRLPAPRFLTFLAAGPAAPVLVYTVIENPRGSKARLKYNPQTGVFALTGKLLPWSAPFHYGWIPHTLSANGSELDIWVVDERPASPGSVIVARPVGILFLESGDHKAIALPAMASHGHVEVAELAQLPEVRRAIEDCYPLRDGEIRNWGDATAARQFILEAQERWLAERGPC
jgi:ADP-ribose pyrophosphatase YjhB (NUDIX family)/inorganic pyrophosphatase